MKTLILYSTTIGVGDLGERVALVGPEDDTEKKIAVAGTTWKNVRISIAETFPPSEWNLIGSDEHLKKLYSEN